jgi:hypothetical protein|tara:strand:- start:879 stop:1310 length:432 start_codon:yes stop_codon:yes gene_type:complete
MFRNLLVGAALLLSGCLVVIEPPGLQSHHNDASSYEDSHGGHAHGGTGIWISDYYIECQYDSYWNESRWYVEVEVVSDYSYYSDEVEVYFYIDSWDRFWTNYGGYDEWFRVFESGYYDCYSGYSFDFVVVDDFGNTDSVSTWW